MKPHSPPSILEKYSDIIDSFKRGDYLDVIARAFHLKPSLLVFYYMWKSCKKVNAPLELIEYINYFLTQRDSHKSELKVLHLDFSATNIPTVDQLLEDSQQFGDSLKSKRIVIEGFLIDNPNLFIHHQKLTVDQRRLLSNMMNILGDTYRLQGQIRAAFASLKLATELYPDSFYSRVNYADVAYQMNNTKLCLDNLMHANHLLYYSNLYEKKQVFDTHNNIVAPVNDLVLKQFFTLSCRCGFLPG